MKTRRLLIAGIGNVFMGDDGFGVEVAKSLAQRSWPEGVKIMDAGIRGIDLTYALMDDYDAAILVDTTSRGGSPGTLYVLDPEPDAATLAAPSLVDAHAMQPEKVLAFLRATGTALRCLRVVGCEPERFGTPDEPCMDLSDAVRAAIEPACELIRELVAELGGRASDEPAGMRSQHA